MAQKRKQASGRTDQQRFSYLRPLIFTPGAAGAACLSTSVATRPLGESGLCFATCELLRRQGSPKHLVTTVSALDDLARGDLDRLPFDAPRIEAQRAACSAPRHSLAGLALDRPRIMGIVNVTPDSFSDGGIFSSTATAVTHALRLVEDGADILDIGGESTRPGSDPVPVDEELSRILPVIEGIRARTSTPISVDTRKPEVMRRAAASGADIINDVSALSYDQASPSTAAELGLPVILMHALGDPKTMQIAPKYDNALLDVFDYLEQRISVANAAGVPRDNIVIDPGIGFGKTVAHNLTILASISLYHSLGVPILLGASRKRFIGHLTGVDEAAARVSGSVAVALAAVAQGAQILRVHDVAATHQALTMWLAATTGEGGEKGDGR